MIKINYTLIVLKKGYCFL